MCIYIIYIYIIYSGKLEMVHRYWNFHSLGQTKTVSSMVPITLVARSFLFCFVTWRMRIIHLDSRWASYVPVLLLLLLAMHFSPQVNPFLTQILHASKPPLSYSLLPGKFKHKIYHSKLHCTRFTNWARARVPATCLAHTTLLL